MNWSKDALISKAKIYFSRAFEEERDSLFFGLNCALGLELLARAALAKISPTLLADPSSQTNLFYALGLKEEGVKPSSIVSNKVIKLCGELISDFNTDLQKVCILILERRNEELHTGGGGFAEYNIDNWIAGFYKACQVLGSFIGENFETLFGREVAREANQIILQDTEKIKKTVLDKISARKKTYDEDFANRPEEIKEQITLSKKRMMELVHSGYHKVECPCCKNEAVIWGFEPLSSHDTIEDDFVIVRKAITANFFRCDVCKLKLTSYAELKAAGLPLHYTNTYQFDPTEYFGIDVDSAKEIGYAEEYSNE